MQILSINYVCQASGTVRDTVSLVVEYRMCQSAVCATSSTLTEQFQFDCLAVATDPDGGDSRMNWVCLLHPEWRPT